MKKFSTIGACAIAATLTSLAAWADIPPVTTVVTSRSVVPGQPNGAAPVANLPHLLTWQRLTALGQSLSLPTDAKYASGIARFTIYGFADCLKPGMLNVNPPGR